jgi:glycosyltransferase involved in cell wall biosynthesis
LDRGLVLIRILFIIDTLMPGGVESQLVDLISRLDRTHFDIHVASLYGDRARERGRHFAPQIEAMGIPLTIFDLGNGAVDKLQGIRHIANLARKLRPDIIQAENYHSNLLTRLARPFLPRRTCLIATIRVAESSKQMFYQRIGRALYTKMVASGPQLKMQLIQQSHVPEKKIEVIVNAIDCDRFANAERGNIRAQYTPETRRLFVSVGRISKQKSVHLSVQAFGILKRQGRLPDDVRMIIAGPQEDEESQRLLTEAIVHDELDKFVIQHGTTRNPEQYFFASDFTLLFSLAEGLSIAMLESLACGRPVIVSNDANEAGVIEEGKTGFIVPTGNVEQLAETMAKIIAMPDERLQAMIPNCIVRAKEYSITSLVGHYSDLYTQIIGR